MNATTKDRVNDETQLSISTRFTEGYIKARAVSGGAELTTFLDATGELDVYSVGTANEVYQLQPDSGETNPWIERDLDIVARQLMLYPGPGNDREHPDIFGLDDEGRLTLSRYDREGDAYQQAVSQPADADRPIVQWASSQYAESGTTYVNVLFDNGEVGHSALASDGTWTSENWVTFKERKEGEGADQTATAKQIAMVEDPGALRSLFGIGLDNRVLFCEFPNHFAYWTTIGTLEAIDIDVLRDQEGLINIFAIGVGHELWVARQNPDSPSIAFDAWQRLGTGGELAEVHSTIDFDGLLSAFCVGTDGLLSHIRQVAGRRRAEWGTLFPLGNPVPNSIFTVGRSDGGYAEAFSVTENNDLYRFWQNPISTQWYNYRIPLEEDGEIISVANHSTEITVLDAAGVPLPGAEVQLRTSNLISLWINGRSYNTSEFRSATIKANTAGMITILRPTNTLAAPIYGLSADGLLDGEVYIYPNGSLQEKMHSTSAEDVLEAKNAEGRYLLEGASRTAENAQAMADIMRQAMSLDQAPEDAPKRSVRHLSRNASTTGLFHRPAGHQGRAFRLLDPKRVREQHWKVSFTEGGVQFAHLDRAGAAALVASKRDELIEFPGIDWGDMWNSVYEQASTIADALQDFVVTTIVDPITGLVEEIRTLFTLVIDGVGYLVDTVIDGFEQAFDIVQGVWRQLGVVFNDLYGWLGTLFAWDDIRRTAAVMKHTFNQSLEFSVAAIRSVKGPIQQSFSHLATTIEEASDAFIQTLGAGETLSGYSEQYADSNPQRVSDVGHNPLLNGFVDFGGETEMDALTIEAKALLEGPLEALAQEIVALTRNFQFGEGKEAFDEALAFIEEIGENPSQILQLSMAALVKVMEGIALFAVAAAEGVTLSIIDLAAQLAVTVGALLNQEWKIPFVSELFESITDEPLSAINLFTLALAVPGTMSYKLVNGVAPYPDDRSVVEFEETFTAAWLAEQAGIAQPATVRSAAERQQIEMVRAHNAEIFTFLSSTLWLAQVALDAPSVVFSATGVDNVNPAWDVASLTSAFVGSALEIPWLLGPDAGGISCSDPDEFGNMIWLLAVVFGPVKSSLLNVVPVPGQVDAYSTSIWGGLHLALLLGQATAAGELISLGMVNNTLQVMAPEILQFASTPEVNTATSGVSSTALVMLIAFTYPVISALLVVEEALGGDDEVDAQRALGGTLEPAALLG